MSEFFLQDAGNNVYLRLGEARFRELHRARNVILEAIAVEENFDALLENYVELEETLFHLGMTHLAFGYRARYDFGDMRNLIGRRLLNLFASARLYRDALLRHASKMFGPGETSEKVTRAMADGPFQPMEYRLVEAIRNYSQHHSLPVSGLTLGSRLEKADERLAYSITPMLNGTAIAAERKLPQEVKVQLLSLGRTEVMPIVRKALERWSEIHEGFRRPAEELTKVSESQIRDAIRMVDSKQSLEMGENSRVSNLALLVHRHGDSVDSVQLFTEPFEILGSFRTKNRSLANLSRRYVEWSNKAKH